MSDITPIQGPLGPKDDAAKKDPKKIGTPEKFKETYRIQAIGETDAGPQKKRKRKEESEEDSLAEAISPLTPSSPKSLTASPYEVQPASKKISSVEGPQPAASAAPTSYSQSYATSSGPMATEESMTVSISSTPLSSTPSSSTSTPSAAPSSGSIPLSEDDYTLDTFSEDYFSFTPAPTYPQTQQTTSYPETYTYENTSSEEQTTPPSAQTNPAPVSAKKKIPLPLEKNANPLNSSTEAIPSSAEEAASGSPWTAKKKGSQDPKPSQVAIDQQTETSSPLQMQSSSPPITAPPKESSAEELGLSWEGDVQPSSALSS
ncbi:MAG: hypothetical protein EBZ47_05875, partial [Chlamydiae bacterium]|nr:hypothetical protein [Chlamydiota bacterium]